MRVAFYSFSTIVEGCIWTCWCFYSKGLFLYNRVRHNKFLTTKLTLSTPENETLPQIWNLFESSLANIAQTKLWQCYIHERVRLALFSQALDHHLCKRITIFTLHTIRDNWLILIQTIWYSVNPTLFSAFLSFFGAFIPYFVFIPLFYSQSIHTRIILCNDTNKGVKENTGKKLSRILDLIWLDEFLCWDIYIPWLGTLILIDAHSLIA